MKNNNLDIYKKILNLKNLVSIDYIFSNIDYIDNVFDKYIYNDNIKKDVLDHENYKPYNFKTLELLLIKERFSVFYPMFEYFYKPTTYKTLSSTVALVNSTSSINKQLKITQCALEELNDQYLIIKDLDSVNSQVIIDGNVFDDFGIIDDDYDWTSNFKVEQNGHQWVGTKIQVIGTETKITLSDYYISDNVYTTESVAEADYRMNITAEARKSFLNILEKEMYFKGTKSFIEFVLKFFYLIKYYDKSMTLLENIDYSETYLTDIVSESDINFVYYITNTFIAKDDWEMYIKPIVHPYGWIAIYNEYSISPTNIIQKEHNLLRNKITVFDILKSSRNNVLNDLIDVQRYGHLKLTDTQHSRGIISCPTNISGKMIIDVFDKFSGDEKLVKDFKYDYLDSDFLENYGKEFRIKNPVCSFYGYTPSNETIITIIDSEESITGVTVSWDIGTVFLEKLLEVPFEWDPYYVNGQGGAVDSDIDLSGGSFTVSNIDGYNKYYIQTIYKNDADDTVYAKSDIIVFDISVSETGTSFGGYKSFSPAKPSPIL